MIGILNRIALPAIFLFFGLSFGVAAKSKDDHIFIWSYFVDGNHEKMVAVQRKAEDNMVTGCYILGDRALINEVLQKTPKTDQYIEDEDKLKSLIKVCNNGKVKGIFTEDSVKDVLDKFEIFSGLFIYPGTLWCGAGNVSVSDDDLGSEVEADKCCRTHAHCKDTIPPFGSKHGLENDSPIVVSNCDCDDSLRTCLKEANTKASNQVGRMFFNVLPIKCFREDYPIKTCKKYSGLVRYLCQEYELDFSKDVTYEFFDHPHYDFLISDEDDSESYDVYSYLLHLEREDMLYKLIKVSEN